MIAARQELDLRPQLERLDRLMLRSEGLDPGAHLRVPAAVAARRGFSRQNCTAEGAGNADLCGAGTVAGGGDGTACRSTARPGRDLSQHVGGVRQGLEQQLKKVIAGVKETLDRYAPSEPRGSDGRWRLFRGPSRGLAEYGSDRPQMASADPPLRRIYPDKTYETDPKAKISIKFWRETSPEDIAKDLKNNKYEPSLVKPDGRVMNGNTRLKVLQERGYPIDTLPRVMQGDPFEEPFGGGGGHTPITKPILEQYNKRTQMKTADF